MCLKARQVTAEPALKEKLNKIAAQALDRAETIKQSKAGSQPRVGLTSYFTLRVRLLIGGFNCLHHNLPSDK
jgi:hypothetical protein